MGSPPPQQQQQQQHHYPHMSLSDPFLEDSSLFDFVFPTDANDPFSGARHSDLPTREPSPIEMLKESNRQLLESNRKLMGLMQDYNHRMEIMESTMKQIADTMSISSRVRS